MNLTPRQQRIKARLYDKLQSLRVTRISDNVQAAALMEAIITDIDQVVEGELNVGNRTEANPKSHHYMEDK